MTTELKGDIGSEDKLTEAGDANRKDSENLKGPARRLIVRKDTPTQLQLFEELFRIAQGQGEAEKTEKISSGGQSSGATVKITSGTDTAGSGKTEEINPESDDQEIQSSLKKKSPEAATEAADPLKSDGEGSADNNPYMRVFRNEGNLTSLFSCILYPLSHLSSFRLAFGLRQAPGSISFLTVETKKEFATTEAISEDPPKDDAPTDGNDPFSYSHFTIFLLFLTKGAFQSFIQLKNEEPFDVVTVP